LTYVLNCAWIGVTSFCGLSIIIYVMLKSVCMVEIEEQRYQYVPTEWGYCLNLSRFGKQFLTGIPLYRNFLLVP